METAGASAIMAIEQSALGVAMRQDLWLYPSVQIIHIWGFVLFAGSIVILDLRLFGLSREVSVRRLARHLLPWTWGALLLIIPTGLLMFVAHAGDLVSNRAFVIKLALLFAAGANACAFHLGPFRSVGQWDSGIATPPAARIHAALSLIIWMSVIACGRLLAYL